MTQKINPSYINVVIGASILLSFLFIILFVFFIIFTVISYFAIKYLRVQVYTSGLFLQDYGKYEKEILNKYGNYPIKNIYLVRNPMSPFFFFFFNIITCYNYSAIFTECEKKYPYHASILLEIKVSKKTKFIYIEKNNCIHMSENFYINSKQSMKKICIEKITLQELLDNTEKRIGPVKFFNWSAFKNNCQNFTKELLITLKKKCKFQDNMMNNAIEKSKTTEFSIYIVNFIVITYNILLNILFKDTSI